MAEVYQASVPAPELNCAVVIPALDPDEHLISLLRGLRAVGFRHLIVVDDGSREADQWVFRQAASEGARCLRHEINLGKGAALRTGFRCIQESVSSSTAVITVDADGQHAADDAARVARACEADPRSLVIGVRSFPAHRQPSVPWRSWLGNRISHYAFSPALEQSLGDTQSGLRGIPSSAIPDLLHLKGDRYEYEANMLIWAARAGVGIKQVPVRTVYLEANRSSHFRPLGDSMRIYFVLLRFYASSLAASAVDLSVFALLWRYSAHYAFSFWSARAASSACNFVLNRRYVFQSRTALAAAVARYYALVAIVGLLSYALSRALMAGHMPVFAAKVCADIAPSVASFVIQRIYVFRRAKNQGPNHSSMV